MAEWRRVFPPAVRFKDHELGNRPTLSAAAGMNTRLAYAVDADYARREWTIWFEDIGTVRLPWLEADPMAFDAWCHEGRLKIFFKHYNGNNPPHLLGVFDTGYQYFE